VAIICILLDLYVIILIGRAILSFFPIAPGGTMYQIASFLSMLTEPVLAPLRRIIPPLGMFDLSFLVLVIGIQILRAAICQTAGFF
jgi:YggT family protein